VAAGGEGGHVDADLGDELPGADPSDAGDLIELGDLGGERGDLLLDPGGELIDLAGEVVDAVQHHLAQEPVVVVEVAGQRLLQQAEVGAQAGAGELGERPGDKAARRSSPRGCAGRRPRSRRRPRSTA
jgi:hypothetical protein